MKKHLLLLSVFACVASVSFAQDNDVVAGIPVNYNEALVGDYKATLPDALVFNNGKPVKNAKQWAKRRAEIVKLFEENEYGKWPEKKPALRYTVEKDLGFDGTAVRKQITVFFSDDNEGPRVDVLVYLPKDANGPSPVLLDINFSPNNQAVSDPGVKEGRRWDTATKTLVPAKSMGGMRFGGLDQTIKMYLKEGFGFATFNYTDITPDFQDNAELGVRGIYPKPGPDGWGAISCWAWGISNIIDYFEVDPDIDATRVALTGCSRLGKTTIWTGARETRIKVVMPSCSGEGGAAISRRNYGETIAHLMAPTRYPYQFCDNYAKWGPDPTKNPVDANLLVALIAPRALLLQTGTTDTWSDAIGEFLAAVEAGPVYKLLGKDDLGTTEMPEADQPIYNTLGYVAHDGGHGTMPQDWKYYLEFMKRYL